MGTADKVILSVVVIGRFRSKRQRRFSSDFFIFFERRSIYLYLFFFYSSFARVRKTDPLWNGLSDARGLTAEKWKRCWLITVEKARTV